MCRAGRKAHQEAALVCVSQPNFLQRARAHCDSSGKSLFLGYDRVVGEPRYYYVDYRQRRFWPDSTRTFE